eukprot:gene26083-47285_t
MRLLLVEDDSMIGEAVQDLLRAEHYAVDWARDGDAADTALRTQPYDLVLLDLGLPKRDGLTVLRDLRTRKDRTPVLVATARDAVAQRIEGLDAGADDYVLKPYDLDELLARIRAVLRRRAPEQVSDSVTIGELVLDAATYRVSYQAQPLKVGPTEFKLLHFLMKHAERVHSRSQLLDKVWGDHVFIEERTVDVHVKRLREALGGASVMVETVRGAGYRLTAQPQVQ